MAKIRDPIEDRLFKLELSMTVRMRSIRMQLDEMKLDMKGHIGKLQQQLEFDSDERLAHITNHQHLVRLYTRPRLDGVVRGLGRSWGWASEGRSLHSSSGVEQLFERIEKMEQNERELKREAMAQRLKADKLAQQLNSEKQIANATKLRQLMSIKRQTDKIKQIVVEIREDIQKSSLATTSTGW